MDNIKNNEQTILDSRELRDNFRNIREFMNTQSYGKNETDEDQMQHNRDSRDNFKHIKEFMNQ